MAFDECPNPTDKEYNLASLERTHKWAIRCLEAKSRNDQALFGIVQGGIFPDLRQKSAELLTSLNFPGYAIGGLSVGESKQDMLTMIEVVNQVLPKDKPRYLMGVGTPLDLIEGIRRGVDMFDCVMPTRLARHHAALTLEGRINLSKAKYANDSSPISHQCPCYTCQNFSKAYLRHLINSKEMLSATLISIHNITVLIMLLKKLREAIIENQFETFVNSIITENSMHRRKNS